MDLSCKICFESFTTNELRRPRSLPCGHTLCGECATRLLIEGQILCPLCQQNYKYENIEKIGINHELEEVIERLTSITTNSSPKLHYGKCEEHGLYKVHHCLTHDIFICSDCVVDLHLEEDCQCVPIGKIFKDRKADLCKKIDTRMSCLEETSIILKDTESYNKIQIEKLQSDIKALHNFSSTCTDLSNECEDKQKQVQSIATFQELDTETQWVESSDQKTQEWMEQVNNITNQGFGGILPSCPFATLVTRQKTYATHTHEGVQRWGHIFSRDGYILMQDFKNRKPPNNVHIIILNDVMKHLSFPRHVYLSFSIKGGASLGTIIIKVNEDAPWRAQQLIDLCVGQTGARYAGTTALAIGDKGMPKEHLSFCYYLDKNNQNSEKSLYPDLENTGNILLKEGSVVRLNTQGGDFRILTREGHTSTWPGPAIGKVVAGFPVITKIIEDNLVKGYSDKSEVLHSNTNNVIIAETGLVIKQVVKMK